MDASVRLPWIGAWRRDKIPAGHRGSDQGPRTPAPGRRSEMRAGAYWVLWMLVAKVSQYQSGDIE